MPVRDAGQRFQSENTGAEVKAPLALHFVIVSGLSIWEEDSKVKGHHDRMCMSGAKVGGGKEAPLSNCQKNQPQWFTECFLGICS